MAILKVARLGHPVLRKVAEPVAVKQITSPDTQRLIDDMVETMREYNGAGLAAPQVHTLQQICVIEVNGNPRYPDAPSIPLTVLINPVVTPLTAEMDDGWEGCLSVPDMRGVVPRYTASASRRMAATASGSTRWPRSSSRASSSTRRITCTASSTSTGCAISPRSRTWPSGTSTGWGTRAG
jgi:peptide deformylase